MFAAEIRKRRFADIRGYPQWRWHLDDVFVKVNGKLCYLWRAVDHEGEVLEAVVTARRDNAAALKLLKRIMKKHGAPRSIVTDGLRAYSAAMSDIGVAAERHEVGGRLNNQAENSHQPFRRRERAMQRATEVQLSSRPGAQPIQSGAPSRHEASLQAETLCCLGRVARPRGIDRRSRDGGRAARRRASVTLTPPLIFFPVCFCVDPWAVEDLTRFKAEDKIERSIRGSRSSHRKSLPPQSSAKHSGQPRQGTSTGPIRLEPPAKFAEAPAIAAHLSCPFLSVRTTGSTAAWL
jgi:IS1 family transposase